MREENVEVAVAVEIHQLDARRSPVRVRRGVERLDREARARPVVVEGQHALVLLRDERDEVHLAVAVEIGRDDVDRARARASTVCAEGRVE